MGTQHSSTTVRNLTKALFGKKHIAYGRILDHWTEIMGQQLCQKTSPQSVRYRKSKTGEITTILVIECSSADALLVNYQKLMILERINHLIGKPRFVDILLEHTSPAFAVKDLMQKQEGFNAVKPELDTNIQDMINHIEDDQLKERLQSYIDAANR